MELTIIPKVPDVSKKTFQPPSLYSPTRKHTYKNTQAGLRNTLTGIFLYYSTQSLTQFLKEKVHEFEVKLRLKAGY